jgi:hypothetical protein
MSAGLLTEEDVVGIRTGRIADPTVKQVAALAAVFGVEPSYLVDPKEPPPLDAELLEGLRDETTRQITREALRLPERENFFLHPSGMAKLNPKLAKYVTSAIQIERERSSG